MSDTRRVGLYIHFLQICLISQFVGALSAKFEFGALVEKIWFRFFRAIKAHIADVEHYVLVSVELGEKGNLGIESAVVAFKINSGEWGK